MGLINQCESKSSRGRDICSLRMVTSGTDLYQIRFQATVECMFMVRTLRMDKIHTVVVFRLEKRKHRNAVQKRRNTAQRNPNISLGRFLHWYPGSRNTNKVVLVRTLITAHSWWSSGQRVKAKDATKKGPKMVMQGKALWEAQEPSAERHQMLLGEQKDQGSKKLNEFLSNYFDTSESSVLREDPSLK